MVNVKFVLSYSLLNKLEKMDHIPDCFPFHFHQDDPIAMNNPDISGLTPRVEKHTCLPSPKGTPQAGRAVP